MRARAGSAALGALLAASLGACGVERVSVGSGEQQANDRSTEASISRDGRYVAFQSNATNLVPDDGADDDIFLRDRATGQTTLVSTTAPGDTATNRPEISANGRYVAFQSGAHLVPEDTGFFGDVFIWDRETGATSRVSVNSAEQQSNGESAPYPSQGSGIAISRSGRYVAFDSSATNLAPGDNNGLDDVFVRDRVAGTTVRIPAESTAEASTQPDGSIFRGIGRPAISLDGRYVSFASVRVFQAPAGFFLRSRADVYVRDMQSGVTTRLSNGAGRGLAGYVTALDRDGTHVAFSSTAADLVPGDTNGKGDVFVRNLSTGTVVRVPAESTGESAVIQVDDPSLSRSGRWLAFTSSSEFFQAVNVYVRDLDTGEQRRLSKNAGNGQGPVPFNINPMISADGRFVAWLSQESDLVENDTNEVVDAFVGPGRPID